MPVYLVTFVLKQDIDQKTYNNFFKALESKSHDYIRLSASAYAVESNEKPTELLARLTSGNKIQPGDNVIVMKLINPYTAIDADSVAYRWIKSHFPNNLEHVEEYS